MGQSTILCWNVWRVIICFWFSFSVKLSRDVWKVKMIKKQSVYTYRCMAVQIRPIASSVDWKMSKHIIWNRTLIAWPSIGMMCSKRNFPSELNAHRSIDSKLLTVTPICKSFLFNYSDFESVLNSIKWPYLGATNEPINPSKDSINKLMMAAEYLFLVSRWKVFHRKNSFLNSLTRR